MPNSHIASLLKDWEKHYIQAGKRVPCQVALAQEDLVRLEALAEVYQLPKEDMLANLISYALREVEAKMPYKPGDRVIRVEEGEPVFEDIGPTPRYLRIRARLEKQVDNSTNSAA